VDVLFFNNDTGAGITATIKDDGSLNGLASLPPNASDHWTHVGSDGRNLVFYNEILRHGTAARVSENGIVQPLPIRPTAIFGEWTNIAANMGWFVLYNTHTGAAATGFVETPFPMFQFRRQFTLPPDQTYTDVLPSGSSHAGARDRIFLFFNRATGAGITYHVDGSGQVTFLTETEKLAEPTSDGWTHVAAQNGEGSGRLYFFHNNTRRGTTAYVDVDGTLRRLKENVDGFQHCTHIAHGQRLVLYERPSQRATSAEIDEDGTLRRLRTLGPIGDFSHIVA
jgi:hypothetical protein